MTSTASGVTGVGVGTGAEVGVSVASGAAGVDVPPRLQPLKRIVRIRMRLKKIVDFCRKGHAPLKVDFPHYNAQKPAGVAGFVVEKRL